MKRGKYKQEIPKKELMCAFCNKIFLGTRPTRKFCSKLCIQRNFALNKPKSNRKYAPKIRKQCNYCGIDVIKTQYSSANYNKAYCNNEHRVLGQKKDGFELSCIVCSSSFRTTPSSVHLRNRKTCSRKCAADLKTQIAEEKRITNPPTQGLLNRRIRYSKKMQEWRTSVFERDNYTCQECNARSGNGKAVILNADHIKPFALYPELRFELLNGRTLCVECHRKTDTYGRKALTKPE